ncbi:MAG: hypothetical protein ACOYXR_04985 [Nitrospirota bacterium]
MTKKPGWRLLACVGAFALAGCVESPVMMGPRSAHEVIDLHLAYPEAFDRVVRALEREGYEIEAADERFGLIRTAPTVREGAGGVSYQTAVIVRMGGTDHESWLAVDHVAVPTFPDEERKIEDVLKGIAP